ncbi:hypothetical protein B0J17DRAFT_630779 [Rhizoctonia solani]|nr:hypothetical protein B0J17DRAFT_630779 [Rhizoctonia solani]
MAKKSPTTGSPGASSSTIPASVLGPTVSVLLSLVEPEPKPTGALVPVEALNQVLIPIQYNVCSNSEDQPATQDTMELALTLPPMEFCSFIAKAMGLEPSEAKLAYTFFGVAKTQPKAVFNTKLQVEEAIRSVKGYIERSQSVKKCLRNLVPKIPNATDAPTPSSSKSALPKSKLPGKLAKHKAAKLQKAVYLKNMIYSHSMLTLWAKQHIETPNIVTLKHPPNHWLFDSSHGASLSSITARQAEVDVKPDVPGSNTADVIFVSNNSLPPTKPKPTMDIINISSTSNSFVDLINTESIPNPAQILTNYPGATGYLLAQLLYELHAAFPLLNFLLFHPCFEDLNMQTVHKLAVQSMYWIIELVGMSMAQALIVLGAAMNAVGADSDEYKDFKGKGKGKAKDKSEY